MRSRHVKSRNKKSRKGGLFYTTNTNKTYKDNYTNWQNRWSKTYSWNADMNWPGISNPGMQPTRLTRRLPGDGRK